ncbi:MAG: tRNA pseudouridine(38-40) synthase TruA [Algiphilus sp.]
MRWAAGIEYAGSRYRGWQKHTHIDSVQARVEAALSRIANHPVAVMASGRTDAGVHARMQVVHFDSEAARLPDAWRMGANTHLPSDIAVQWVMPVAAEFHARYSASARRYRYVILNRPTRSALWAERAWWFARPLGAARMHAAAQCLLGEHDFSAFRAAECQSPTPMRRLSGIAVARSRDFLYVDVEGNAFLHHMVRKIVGSLVRIGQGSAPVEWMAELLAGRDRTRAGATANAEGLYLLGATYPDYPDIVSPCTPDLA